MDEMVEAIRRKFAPDIAESLRTCEQWTMANPDCREVRLPIQAATSVIYQKEVARFAVNGSFNIRDKDWIHSQYFFAEESLKTGDAYQMIDYLFDKLKHQFKTELAAYELEKALNEGK